MEINQIKDAIYYLGICQELWQWMYDEKKSWSSDKRDWPGWKEHEEMESSCPCCEFASKYYKKSMLCVQCCLLVDLWPNGCGYSPSPYYFFSEDKGTQTDALKIINGCKDKIIELKAMLKETDDED